MTTMRRQYLAPAIHEQGSVVSATKATTSGECWDGKPTNPDDLRKCPKL